MAAAPPAGEDLPRSAQAESVARLLRVALGWSFPVACAQHSPSISVSLRVNICVFNSLQSRGHSSAVKETMTPLFIFLHLHRVQGVRPAGTVSLGYAKHRLTQWPSFQEVLLERTLLHFPLYLRVPTKGRFSRQRLSRLPMFPLNILCCKAVFHGERDW